MAKGRNWLPRWLQHRQLVGLEALLLVGALNQWIGDRVAGSQLPNWGKVLFTMASTAGLFGVFLLTVQVIARGSVARTHQVARGVLGGLALHAVALLGIFLLYAWVLRLAIW
jgi:hypothetical protein